MRRYEGEVHQGLSGWDINSDQELCSVDTTWIDSMPLAVGDNIRLRSEETGIDAAYTIARTHDDGSQWVRMGSAARDKCYPDTTTSDIFTCSFVPSVPNIESRSASEAQSRDELYEETHTHPSHEFAITAPHGRLEHRTHTQAQACQEYLFNSSLWVSHCFDHRGYPYDFDRWHITSADLAPVSFPGLDRLRPYDYRAAVSFHGYSGDEVLVGGRAPDGLREAVRDRLDVLDATTVRLADDEAFDGDDPENFVNWITDTGDHGVQLEMPFDFRDTYAAESGRGVAKAFVDYFD